MLYIYTQLERNSADLLSGRWSLILTRVKVNTEQKTRPTYVKKKTKKSVCQPDSSFWRGLLAYLTKALDITATIQTLPSFVLKCGYAMRLALDHRSTCSHAHRALWMYTFALGPSPLVTTRGILAWGTRDFVTFGSRVQGGTGHHPSVLR